MPLIKFKKIDPEAIVPSYANRDAAGFDIYAPKTITILPGCMIEVPLGFATEIETGFWVDVRPRSGHARKGRITIQNSPGTVDEDYRGEWIALMCNNGQVPYKIEKGKACAQGIVFKRYEGYFHEVDHLNETKRGAGGFGSTDNKTTRG